MNDRRAWFHWRLPGRSEGFGYGPACWQGWLAIGGFVAGLTLTEAMIRHADLGAGLRTPVGAAASLAELVAFLWFADRFSDRR